jgi:hypothetical protein
MKVQKLSIKTDEFFLHANASGDCAGGRMDFATLKVELIVFASNASHGDAGKVDLSWHLAEPAVSGRWGHLGCYNQEIPGNCALEV